MSMLSESKPARSAVLVSGFINVDAPYPQCHASTVVEIAPGKLGAAWFGGTREGASDASVWFALHDGASWLPAVRVADGVQKTGASYPTWNPVLFQPVGLPLHLFYKVGPSPSEWWGMVKTSTNGGRAWSEARKLPDGILGPIKNKPVVLSDGTWLCPSSRESRERGWQVVFERTSDGGRTWRTVGPIGKGKNPELEAIQPSVLFLKAGGLQALCRTRNGRIASTRSGDNGLTWRPLAPTDLLNPNSGIDAVTLQDGRQLLVYNPSLSPTHGAATDNRFPLCVALSDDGRQWRNVLTLETIPCPSGYSYPAVIQGEDRRVHITYTWNRHYIKYVAVDATKLG